MTSEDRPPESPSYRAPAEMLSRAAGAIFVGCGLLGLLAAVRTLVAWNAGWMTVLDAAYTALVHWIAALILWAPVAFMSAWLALRNREGTTSRAIAATSLDMPAPNGPADRLDEVRRLLAEEDWKGVEVTLQEITSDGVADPRIAQVVEEAARARTEAGERWRGLMQAARDVNDPARLLELHEDRPEVFDDQARRELDQELANWFLAYVHRRLRSGGLQHDLVALVDRASEAFAHTKDGASLRASLPTLRRGVGLCARCGKPYNGFSEACPECMGRPEPPPPHIPGLDATEEFDVRSSEYESPEGRWFVDPDEGPGANGRPAV